MYSSIIFGSPIHAFIQTCVQLGFAIVQCLITWLDHFGAQKGTQYSPCTMLTNPKLKIDNQVRDSYRLEVYTRNVICVSNVIKRGFGLLVAIIDGVE